MGGFKNFNNKKEEQKKKECRKIGFGWITPTVMQVDEASIIKRAVDRAGKNKNLKGHVFEIMTCDKINRAPGNIVKGRKAVLTKSTSAVRDDIVVKQGGKVVQRMQLKDTPKGINDTVKRVLNGQYKGTNLIGTRETVEAYNKGIAIKNTQGKSITQKMSTNGISSKQTELIASKALGGSIMKNSSNIIASTKIAAKSGALMSGGIETVNSAIKVMKGEKSIQKAVRSVAEETALGAVSSSIGNTVGNVTSIAVLSTPAAPAAVPVGIAANMGASIVSEKAMRIAGKWIRKK